MQLVYRSGGKVVRVPFAGDALAIGRGDENDVRPMGAGLSRTHCRVARMGDGFVVEDLGSSNGTFVNGERVAGAPVRVKPGDVIRAGSLELSLEAGEPEVE